MTIKIKRCKPLHPHLNNLWHLVGWDGSCSFNWFRGIIFNYWFWQELQLCVKAAKARTSCYAHSIIKYQQCQWKKHTNTTCSLLRLFHHITSLSLLLFEHDAINDDVDVAYESVDLLTDNKASSDTLLGEQHVSVHTNMCSYSYVSPYSTSATQHFRFSHVVQHNQSHCWLWYISTYHTHTLSAKKTIQVCLSSKYFPLFGPAKWICF